MFAQLFTLTIIFHFNTALMLSIFSSFVNSLFIVHFIYAPFIPCPHLITLINAIFLNESIELLNLVMKPKTRMTFKLFNYRLINYRLIYIELIEFRII